MGDFPQKSLKIRCSTEMRFQVKLWVFYFTGGRAFLSRKWPNSEVNSHLQEIFISLLYYIQLIMVTISSRYRHIVVYDKGKCKLLQAELNNRETTEAKCQRLEILYSENVCSLRSTRSQSPQIDERRTQKEQRINRSFLSS